MLNAVLENYTTGACYNLGMGTADLDRYVRQTIFPGVGVDGQRKLLAAKAVVVGCGALGSSLANMLARAGVGRLVVVDRDFVELNNLQRQVLYDEDDVARNLPKAVAAANRLRRINSQISVEPVVADVSSDNVESLVGDASIVLDGTDNFDTRYLVNDACVKHDVPWIYGAGVAAVGMTMTIRPHAGPCLRCLYPRPPRAGSLDTCDTAGVVAPIIQVVSAWQVAEAMKYLTGSGRLNEALMRFDVWENVCERFNVPRLADCPTCVEHRFEYLEATAGTFTTALCGRKAVQVRVRGAPRLALDALRQKLAPSVSDIAVNEYMLRFAVDNFEVSVFPDARAIVKGTDDEGVARSVYAKYIGA